MITQETRQKMLEELQQSVHEACTLISPVSVAKAVLHPENSRTHNGPGYHSLIERIHNILYDATEHRVDLSSAVHTDCAACTAFYANRTEEICQR